MVEVAFRIGSEQRIRVGNGRRFSRVPDPLDKESTVEASNCKLKNDKEYGLNAGLPEGVVGSITA